MRIVFQKSPPFVVGHVEPGAEWDDHADRLLTLWLQEKGVLVGKNIAADAIEIVARRNSFHPIADYLNKLTWDGNPRLDWWLVTYLGAPTIEYIRAVGPRWMISGVARIYVPGAKVDSVLILKGPQGKRKSMALAELAGAEYFSDHISALGSKDSLQELLGIWIVEMAELASIRRTTLDQVKAFLTTRIELWAEAVHRYRAGEPWWIDTEALSAIVEEIQEDHYVPGHWDEVILPWLDAPFPRVENGRDGNSLPIGPFTSTPNITTVLEVLIHAIRKEPDKINRADQMAVARCLAHAKWEPKRSGNRRWYERTTPLLTTDDSLTKVSSDVNAFVAF